MRVFVTGSAGFIGRHVVKALEAAGNEVTGYDWPDNVCELGNVEGFDAVVNLAAIGGVGRAARSPAEVMKNNVGASVALRGALRPEAYGLDVMWPTVVHISSFSIYGDAPVPTTTDAPIRPKEVYGASKAAQELCWTGYPGPLVVFRMSSVYGSGMALDNPESTVIAKIAQAVRDGKEFPVFEDGLQERDWVHVGDVCDAIIAMVQGDHAPAPSPIVVNICSGERVSLLDACKLLGAKVRMTGESRPGDMRVCYGDAGPLEKLLGRPTHKLRDYWRELLR